MNIENCNEKTVEFVRRWIAAKRTKKRAEAQLTQANLELDSATNALGAWICPDDAKLAEGFNIWYGSGLLHAELSDPMVRGYTVNWRKEPDGKQLIEEGC